MKIFNETEVLDFYLKEMEKGSIAFLNGRDRYHNTIKECIVRLKKADGMNDKIVAAKELWKSLFEASMSFIDPDKRGYDTLFRYFDEYVEFEELIFASDSFYRDHTLHCLWVYFLGEYLIRQDEFKWIDDNMNEQFVVMEKNKEMIMDIQMEDVFQSVLQVLDNIMSVHKNFDSIRCIAAITHDLGYPIKKIEKINKSIKNILPFYSINNYDEFNFNYTETQQNYISKFIDFLSCSILTTSGESLEGNDPIVKTMILDGPNLKGFHREEVLKLNQEELKRLKRVLTVSPKIRRSLSKNWVYSRDLEEYNHGIMSALLLLKNVKAFSNLDFNYYDYVDSSLDELKVSDIYTKQDILKSITDHTSDGFQITDIDGFSEFLTFMDELEEFSRISRANQNREFITEFCSTSIYMADGVMNIDFVFDNEHIYNLDPERAFKGRCLRFLSLFNIPKLSERLKIRLRCIGKLTYDNNIYSLEIARKYARIDINGEEKSIPNYLKSKQLYTREEYAQL